MNIERFRDLLGADYFYDASENLEAYSKDHSFVSLRKPLAIVKPRNTEEIKEIIDLANETHTPLIPTSSGFPKFHGTKERGKAGKYGRINTPPSRLIGQIIYVPNIRSWVSLIMMEQ